MNSPMASSHDKYCFYILRLWRAESPDVSWRASLENPHTGERIGFENLERLFAYLMEQAEDDPMIKKGEQDGNLLSNKRGG